MRNPIFRALFVVVPLLAPVGCASESEVGSDKGTLPEDPQKISSTAQAITTSEIMARADEYIAAKVPYCGGVRGGTDYICGGTCVRPAAAWDAYRSDCSGFVSWCWQIASDPTTSVLMSDRTGPNGWTTIKIDELSAGDAVVCDGHVKLFSKFASANSAEIYEEYDCGKVGRKAVQSFTRSGETIKFSGDSRVYHAIRRNGLTPSVVVKGYLDSADTSLVGWAVDMNSKATHLGVDLYVDGDPGKGHQIHTTADVARPDVASAIGVDPNHGFSVATPLYFCDAKAHSIGAFATPADGKSAVALSLTAKSLTCPIPAALPGVLRHVVDPTSLAAWHFDPVNQLRWMTAKDRDAYVKAGDLPAKPTLKRTADGRVFLIDDTYKRHVKDPASFKAWGFDDASVVAMSDTEAASFVDGIDLPSAPVLVQAVDGPAVYLLDGAEPSPTDPTPVTPGDPGDPGSGNNNGATPSTPASQRSSDDGEVQGSCATTRAPAKDSLAAALGSAFVLAFVARRRRPPCR